MKKTRNGMRITGLLLTMGMLVSLLGVVGLTARPRMRKPITRFLTETTPTLARLL